MASLFWDDTAAKVKHVSVGCAAPCSSPWAGGGNYWVHCTMFQLILCLSSFRSQQREMGLLEQLVRKSRIGFIFSSIIMYRSPTTFMKGCTKVKSHKRICDVKLVRHVGRKREKKDAKAVRPRSWRKRFCWSKVKSKWLAFIVTWYEECEREKRRKRWGNN